MKTSTTPLSRMGNLLKIEVSDMEKALVITLGCMAGLALLHSFGPVEGRESFHREFLAPFLFIGGAVFTSFAFRELKDGARAISYMLLPANPLEKFMVKLLSATVGYALALVAAYWLGSSLGEGIRYLATGDSHGIFNPFTMETLRMLAGYLVFASVFLFGAIAFNSYHFVKTVLAMIVLGIGIGIFAAAAFRIIFHSYFDGMHLKPVYVHMGVMADHLGYTRQFDRGGGSVIHVLGAILLHGIIPVLITVASYFKFREREV
ncbi:hypothetical protein KKF84_01850 [Myxococcota bacterium]|nr:hypothetical protein [Myxococcota bacterium]MBU1534029.1 hypothetical protein [Myxococcota bacterium]